MSPVMSWSIKHIAVNYNSKIKLKGGKKKSNVSACQANRNYLFLPFLKKKTFLHNSQQHTFSRCPPEIAPFPYLRRRSTLSSPQCGSKKPDSYPRARAQARGRSAQRCLRTL